MAANRRSTWRLLAALMLLVTVPAAGSIPALPPPAPKADLVSADLLDDVASLERPEILVLVAFVVPEELPSWADPHRKTRVWGLNLGSETQPIGESWFKGETAVGVLVVRFYHADGLGSVRALTDDTGAVTDRYSFTAFGELLEHVGDDPNAYLFAGEPLDPNAGFYYNRARWMDPAVGRFVSVDPFEGWEHEPATLHKYLYVAGNAPNSVDPTGYFSQASLNMASAVLGYLNTMTMIYTAGYIGFGVGSLIRGLAIDETMSLEEAADEAGRIGAIAAINYLFNFGGLKIAASIARKLGSLLVIRVFSTARVNGRLAEHFIGNAYGMLRNTATKIGGRIPDFINSKVIREIKNVQYLRWTGQIRLQLQTYAIEAAASGRKFFIHVRGATEVDPRVMTELERIFGPGTRGRLWDIINDIPETMRVIP